VRPSGRGETGCAFRGAKMALQPIADAAHLVHGPASCEAGSWEFRPTRSSGPLLHRMSFSSDLEEIDIVRGGEGKLMKAIGAVIERYRPPAVFVYQTCLPAMIGDDIRAVCGAAAEHWRRPVIPVEAHGFAGSRPYGNHLAAEALLRHVVGTGSPDHETATDINLIGEFNLAGELDRIRPLLGRLGIRILASISGDGRYADIAAAHRAKAALLLCSQGLARLAEGMRERYGIPFIDGSFHGVANSSQTLRRLARLLAQQGTAGDLPERTERLIAGEEARVARGLAGYRSRFAGKRALLMSGGVKSWSLAATLRDAGFEVVGTASNKTSRRDRRKLVEVLEGDAFRLENWPAGNLLSLLRDAKVDVVLAGGDWQYPILQAGVPWVEVNHQRHIALSAYDGTLALLAEIDRAIGNPVWRQVSGPAPWDDDWAGPRKAMP
jgi:nitrogenase molybdenum-cofactor synthesis protein NifE